jgi:hypothetical protein
MDIYTIKYLIQNFHRRTLQHDIIKVSSTTDAHENCLKRVLKFTLKQLQHVSV